MRTGGRDAGAWIPDFAGMTGWGRRGDEVGAVGVALRDTRFTGMAEVGAVGVVFP